MNARPTAGDWAMLLSLTVMWGSAFLLTKVAVGSVPPELVVAGRLVVGSVLLLMVALTLVRRLPTGRRTWLFYVLIAVFGNALPISLITWGQEHIDSGLAGILMAVIPLVTLGLAHYTLPGERMTVQRAAGFLLGFLGILVLTGPQALQALGDMQGTLWPMLAVLGGAVCYSIASILARLGPTHDALSTAASTTLLATLLMLPFVLSGNDLPHDHGFTGGALLAVLALGVFSTAVAAIVYYRLIRRAGPAFVSQLSYFIPLWAVAVGAVFLGEALQPGHLYALLLILGGVYVAQARRLRIRLPAASGPQRASVQAVAVVSAAPRREVP